MDKPILAVVVWNDAHGDSVMFDTNSMDHKPYQFTIPGLLLQSDETGVSLAQEIGDDGRYRGHTFIPRAMIVQEWIIGPLRKPRKPKPQVAQTT